MSRVLLSWVLPIAGWVIIYQSAGLPLFSAAWWCLTVGGFLLLAGEWFANSSPQKGKS